MVASGPREGIWVLTKAGEERVGVRHIRRWRNNARAARVLRRWTRPTGGVA
jgi:hypothetical protein